MLTDKSPRRHRAAALWNAATKERYCSRNSFKGSEGEGVQSDGAGALLDGSRQHAAHHLVHLLAGTQQEPSMEAPGRHEIEALLLEHPQRPAHPPRVLRQTECTLEASRKSAERREERSVTCPRRASFSLKSPVSNPLIPSPIGGRGYAFPSVHRTFALCLRLRYVSAQLKKAGGPRPEAQPPASGDAALDGWGALRRPRSF
jgi:hypothetical protein